MAVVSAAGAGLERSGWTAVLRTSRQRLDVDRVLALSRLRRRPIPVVPADDDGFVGVDKHGRARGVDRV